MDEYSEQKLFKNPTTKVSQKFIERFAGKTCEQALWTEVVNQNWEESLRRMEVKKCVNKD